MRRIFICLNTIIALFFSSCTDLSETNENPNNVEQTHPQLLLTELSHKAFSVEGKGILYAARMIVQTDGENSGQYYNWQRGSFDNYNRLRDVNKMMEESERTENETYLAVAKFFKAFYFYKLTLSFGDIPYSEAVKGETEEVYTPEYDSQKKVFMGILKELEEANNILSHTDEIMNGDIIYDGHPLAWRKLINSFRLRVLMTLSNKTSDSDFKVAATFASIVNNQPIIASNSESGALTFIDQEGSQYTEFNESSYGSGLYMDGTFIDMLQEHQDPRLFIFCGRTRNALEAGLAKDDFDAYNGGNPLAPYAEINDQAAAGEISKPNLRYTTDPTTEPHNLLSYSEVEFLLAEAIVRGWINGDAHAHYEKGVRANFEFYNTYAKDGLDQYVKSSDADTYLSGTMVNFSNAFTLEQKIEMIITQKYFTSFLQSGSRMYFEHLRTGYPEFVHNQDATPPTRWMYPQSEYLRNQANVAKAIESQYGTGNDGIRQIPWWLQ